MARLVEPTDFGEEFLNVVKVFSLFRYYLPLEEDEALCLIKHKIIPFTQGCFEPIWLKLAQ